MTGKHIKLLHSSHPGIQSPYTNTGKASNKSCFTSGLGTELISVKVVSRKTPATNKPHNDRLEICQTIQSLKPSSLFRKSVHQCMFTDKCLLPDSIPSNKALPYNVHGEGNGTPLQYSCLENPMDGGAWWAAVHGVAMSRTQLSDFTFTFHFHALEKEMATHSSVLAWRIPGTGEPDGRPSMGLHRVRHD